MKENRTPIKKIDDKKSIGKCIAINKKSIGKCIAINKKLITMPLFITETNLPNSPFWDLIMTALEKVEKINPLLPFL